MGLGAPAAAVVHSYLRSGCVTLQLMSGHTSTHISLAWKLLKTEDEGLKRVPIHWDGVGEIEMIEIRETPLIAFSLIALFLKTCCLRISLSVSLPPFVSLSSCNKPPSSPCWKQHRKDTKLKPQLPSGRPRHGVDADAPATLYAPRN